MPKKNNILNFFYDLGLNYKVYYFEFTVSLRCRSFLFRSFLSIQVTLFNLILLNQATAQKLPYIPLYLQNTNDVNGNQFTWSKTAQSDNFTLIWGNGVGLNPETYTDPDLRFNPRSILDTLETVYRAFKIFNFANESPNTNLSKYKIPIILYGTFGPDGSQGFANGGPVDDIIGAFWVHPNGTRDGKVMAHELTHSLQAQIDIDDRIPRGLGYSMQKTGIFWETHANFMGALVYPEAALAIGMDLYHIETWGDWKNAYESYHMLFGLMQADGIEIINRIWRESFSDEYPLQAYKRLSGYTQKQLNDKIYDYYAKRMVSFDFNHKNVGSFFRKYRSSDLTNSLESIQPTYTILRQNPYQATQFYVPIELAPEEYAYNIVPLYVTDKNQPVIVGFKGHTEVNSHAGWRYGFVSTKIDGTISRYSQTYMADQFEIGFTLRNDESKLYLVVMGAPVDNITTNPTNDTWQGYPKHFRYPYEVVINGAVPEGFQTPAEFRKQLKTNGHLHPNGKGWVANSVTIDPSVFVASGAIVLDNSVLRNNVRIEGTAIVQGSTISNNVIVENNALVINSTLSQNARVQGQSFLNNNIVSGNALLGMRAKVSNYKLSGTVEVGGDVLIYNDQGICDNGVHYRMTNYYQNNLLECDGRTAVSPANADVNNPITYFTDAQMQVNCGCSTPTITAFNGIFVETGGEYVVLDNLNFSNTNIIGTNRNDPFGTVAFTNNAGWSQASNTGFVDGYVQKTTANPFIFPVGDNGVYRPLQISGIESEGTFTSAYFGANPSQAITSSLTGGNYPVLPQGAPFNTNTKASSIQTISESEYWDVNGDKNCTITLSYDPCSNISTLTSNDLAKLSIVGWSISENKWVLIPSKTDINALSGVVSTLCEGSISTTGIIKPDDYSVFTLASKAVTVALNSSVGLKLGTNSGTKSANAVLEMEVTRMGLLLPKISLSSSTSITPMTGTTFSSSVPGGMLVYNTASQNDVQPGCYISDGTKWGKLISVGNDILKLGISNPNSDGSLPINSAIITTSINVTLPTATPALGGTVYFIRNNTSPTASINVANLIDFGGTQPLLFSLSPSQGAITVICDGSNWYRIN